MSKKALPVRLLLILGIVVVSLLSLFLRHQIDQRRFEREEAEANRPDVRARAALAEADQAIINRDDETAQAALLRAREALDEALAEQPTEGKLLRSRLVVARRLAAAALADGNKTEAAELLADAQSRAQVLFEQDKLADRARRDLLVVARERGALLTETQQHGPAAQVLTEAATAVEAAQKALPGEALLQGELAEVWLDAATAHHAAQALDEAAQALRTGADRAEAATRGGEDPVAALAQAYTTIGRAARLAETLKLPEAADLARRCVRLLEEQKALTPNNSTLDRSLAQWHGQLADLAEAAQDEAGAAQAHDTAIALHQKLMSRQAGDVETRRDLVRALNSHGAFHSSRGRHEAALARYTEAAAAAEPLGEDRVRVVALGNVAHLLGRLDRMDEARATAEKAYDLARVLVGRDPKDAVAARDAAAAGLRQARLLRAPPRPDPTRALALARSERDRLRTLGAAAERADLVKGLDELIVELEGAKK